MYSNNLYIYLLIHTYSKDTNIYKMNNLCVDLHNLGLEFYKQIEYKHNYRTYIFNVYKVVDLDMFDKYALFNGWLLTPDYKYSCNSLDVPPCSWGQLISILDL